MIIREHWDVLVVDDEPDVLAITRLALKQIQLYGIPLRIHECTSKADAIKYLQATAELSDLTLAIVDVVMETEHAGLDVCKFIRDDLGNRITPIIVRTGQAGKAPERDVIERYDISTYLTKVEATSEKLYATVITALRNYLQVIVYESALGFASWLSSQTREGVIRGIPEVINGALLTRRDGSTLDSFKFHFCLLTDREAIPVGKFTGREAEARALRDRLAKEPLRVVNQHGDRYLQSGDHMLISLARTDDAPAFDLIGMTNYEMTPDFVVRAVALFMQCARNRMYPTSKQH
jgi:CheY-like chemotaxis protein